MLFRSIERFGQRNDSRHIGQTNPRIPAPDRPGTLASERSGPSKQTNEADGSRSRTGSKSGKKPKGRLDEDRGRATASETKAERPPALAEGRSESGDSGAVRTRDPQLRRLLLYPTELRNRSDTAKLAQLFRICNTGLPGFDMDRGTSVRRLGPALPAHTSCARSHMKSSSQRRLAGPSIPSGKSRPDYH